MDDVEFQFEQLIEKILKEDSLKLPLVIVLDALDECNPYETLLQTLKKWFQLSLPCKLFLTSRPEHNIKQKLSNERVSFIHLLTGKDISTSTTNDIRLFIKSGFSEICEAYNISVSWPITSEIEDVVKLAAGLFIWATTALKYIGDHLEDDEFGPEDQLKQVISG